MTTLRPRPINGPDFSIKQRPDQFSALRDMLFPSPLTVIPVAEIDGPLDLKDAVINVRVSRQMLQVTTKLAAQYDMPASEFVRRLIYGIATTHASYKLLKPGEQEQSPDQPLPFPAPSSSSEAA